jgi:hypothetical protein
MRIMPFRERRQQPAHPALEFGEVLIEDGLVMETEPAGGLAHGESEDGRAE